MLAECKLFIVSHASTVKQLFQLVFAIVLPLVQFLKVLELGGIHVWSETEIEITNRLAFRPQEIDDMAASSGGIQFSGPITVQE